MTATNGWPGKPGVPRLEGKMSDDLVLLDPDVWRVQTLNINGQLYVKLSDVHAALENLRQFAESVRKIAEKYKGGKDE